ncbi:MAG: flagellar assembly protein FliW [Synergistaceae bacterium]|jgi:flagellar assembly factor FliW|nr:flagellar assembly protein FliW [Synergistaceae bacterium]
MIKLTSTRFGELEIDDGDVIQFPLGIPGFEDKRRWVLIGDEDNAIMWMHSTEDEALALPVAAPDSVKSDYNAQIPRESLEPIGDVREGDVAILIVVTIPPDRPWDMTANLKAPIVVNRADRVAMQTIALNDDYDFRYPVLEERTRNSMREQATASKGAGG